MQCAIVVPTYNEAENLPELARRVTAALPEAHLLIVDDNSPDGTAQIAQELFASRPEYSGHRVMLRQGERGLGRAYRDGFRKALADGYERVIQMDADLSHDPAYLPEMLALSKDADLVIGSRYCAGGGVESWPMRRVLLSRFAVRYVKVIAGISIADATAGFRCWTRNALLSLELDSLQSEGYCFQVETAYRACRLRLRTVEMPIVFTDRRFGRSKISRAVLLESFLMPFRLRSHPWVPTQAVAADSSETDALLKGSR
jgi:dolichol-phosphate mannosyltransferase